MAGAATSNSAWSRLAQRLPADVDRQALAAFVLTVMEGGVMQSRTYRDLAAFDACVGVLRDYFNRLEAAAASAADNAGGDGEGPHTCLE